MSRLGGCEELVLPSPPRFKSHLLLCSYYYALFIFKPKPTLRNHVWFHSYLLFFLIFIFSFLTFLFFYLFFLGGYFYSFLFYFLFFKIFLFFKDKVLFFGKPKSTQGVNNVVQGPYSSNTTVTSIVVYSQLSNF